MSCNRCKGTSTDPHNFLLCCSRCGKNWHHRAQYRNISPLRVSYRFYLCPTGCHIPPLNDTQLIALLRATNSNDVDNGLSSWIGRCCRKKRVRAQATPEVGIYDRTLRDMTSDQGSKRPPFVQIPLYLLLKYRRLNRSLYLHPQRSLYMRSPFLSKGQVHCLFRNTRLITVTLIKHYFRKMGHQLRDRMIDLPSVILVSTSPLRRRDL